MIYYAKITCLGRANVGSPPGDGLRVGYYFVHAESFLLLFTYFQLVICTRVEGRKRPPSPGRHNAGGNGFAKLSFDPTSGIGLL